MACCSALAKRCDPAGSDIPQQAVSPPSNPTDGGPSLAVNMIFIQDTLNEQGPIHWVSDVHDSDNNSQVPIVL